MRTTIAATLPVLIAMLGVGSIVEAQWAKPTSSEISGGPGPRHRQSPPREMQVEHAKLSAIEQESSSRRRKHNGNSAKIASATRIKRLPPATQLQQSSAMSPSDVVVAHAWQDTTATEPVGRLMSFSEDSYSSCGECPCAESEDPSNACASPTCAYHDEEKCDSDDSLDESLGNILSIWESLEIYGHVRVRHETDFERINRPTRNRERLRARLGLTYTWNDEIKAGIRWTTGDRKIVLESGDRSGSPLSYQDTGDVFDKFEFNLDRIFVTYNPHWLPDLFVTIGKFKPTWKLNPIFSSPVGDLVWDEAAQPEGIAAGYTRDGFLGFDQAYATIGESAVLELSNQDDSSLFFLQMWGEKQIGARWKVAPSLTWYDWSNLNPDGNTRISTENNAGNSVTQVGINTTQIGETSPGGIPVIDGRPLFVFDSGFNIVNPMIVLTYDDGDDCIGVHPLQFVYEAFYNDESFDAQRAFGYSMGAQYGPAVTRQGRQKLDWKVYYSWNEVEQESVFTPVAQDDFQLATNFRGHWVGLDLYPWKNVEVRFWLLSTKPIVPITVAGVTSNETQWRFRADITAYF